MCLHRRLVFALPTLREIRYTHLMPLLGHHGHPRVLHIHNNNSSNKITMIKNNYWHSIIDYVSHSSKQHTHTHTYIHLILKIIVYISLMFLFQKTFPEASSRFHLKSHWPEIQHLPRGMLVFKSLIKNSTAREFPLWLSGLQTQLVSMRMRVRSLALLSGFRILHCCELWSRSQKWLGSHVAVAVA